MFCEYTSEVKELSDRYVRIEQIGQGTYGKVYKCRDVVTNEIVALKKINILKPLDGFPLSTIREINLLGMLKHENIVALKNIVSVKEGESQTNRVYLAFEYCEFDLCGLLYTDSCPLSSKHICSYIRQLLLALIECQKKNIVHRDLKPANIFVTRNNIIKVGDFGLARQLNDYNSQYTSNVITLYYRAPELLLNCTEYKYEIDIWSVGCIIFEMVTKKTLFRPTNAHREVDQLKTIFNLCGTPDLKEWPQFVELDKDGTFRSNPMPSKFMEYLDHEIPTKYGDAADLIFQMCQLTPSKRISAEEAYMHPFLSRYGDEIEPSKLPKLDFSEAHQMQIPHRKPASHEKEEPVQQVRPQQPVLDDKL